QHLHRATSVVRVAERVTVGVHVEVTIEEGAFEPYAAPSFGAKELVDELAAMVQRVADALAQEARNLGDGGFAEPAPDGISTERQWQATGEGAPRFADVGD